MSGDDKLLWSLENDRIWSRMRAFLYHGMRDTGRFLDLQFKMRMLTDRVVWSRIMTMEIPPPKPPGMESKS